MSNQNSRSPFPRPLLLLFIVGIMFVLPNVWFASAPAELSYSDFKALLRQGRIAQVQMSDHTIHGTLRPVSEAIDVPERPHRFITVRVADPGLLRELEAQGSQIRGQFDNPFLRGLLAWLIPLGLGFLLWNCLARPTGFGQGVAQFGKSRAQVRFEPSTAVTFADVADAEEAKEELAELIDFLRQPQKYAALGGRIPKGVLLVGAPGTGKTLLARAVAGEAHVPCISLNGADFVEMFVGVGAARVRDLFRQAREMAPCIVFIDELDAVGKARGSYPWLQHHDEREQTLHQLLSEMDGFTPPQGIILLAATNRPEILDAALLRAGRFDRQVVVGRKVTLVPHGPAALGHTQQFPAQERYLYTREELLDRITVMLGGRAAEAVVFQDTSTGAQDDLQRASDMARRMVAEFGMSDLLGPYAVEPGRQSPFLDRAAAAVQVYSTATAQHIDREAQAIVTRMYQRARQLLAENRHTLEILAQYLLKHEAMDQHTFAALTSEMQPHKTSVLIAS